MDQDSRKPCKALRITAHGENYDYATTALPVISGHPQLAPPKSTSPQRHLPTSATSVHLSAAPPTAVSEPVGVTLWAFLAAEHRLGLGPLPLAAENGQHQLDVVVVDEGHEGVVLGDGAERLSDDVDEAVLVGDVVDRRVDGEDDLSQRFALLVQLWGEEGQLDRGGAVYLHGSMVRRNVLHGFGRMKTVICFFLGGGGEGSSRYLTFMQDKSEMEMSASL